MAADSSDRAQQLGNEIEAQGGDHSTKPAHQHAMYMAAIPDGSWGLFRLFPDGVPPAANALDGRRVLVQLRDGADLEHGGSCALKRWRVAGTDKDGGVRAVDLRPDNPSFATMHMKPDNGEIRAIAEVLEVLG